MMHSNLLTWPFKNDEHERLPMEMGNALTVQLMMTS